MKVLRSILLAALVALGGSLYAQEAAVEPSPAAAAATPATAASSAWATAADAEALQAEMAAFFADAEVRTIGSPGNAVMEERLAALFADSGFANGEIRFQLPALRSGAAHVEVPGVGKLPMLPLHPGIFRPGNFPQDDLNKRLIYVGKAGVSDLQRLKGQNLQGTIAVVEFNSGYDWLRLMRFGVEGFIFLAADNYDRASAMQKITTTEVAVPRFFLEEPHASRLRTQLQASVGGVEAAIHAEASTYETIWARDLWVFIPGADTDTLARQVVTFVAPIDSNGVAPDIAESATNGANLFLLAKMLEDFKANPPQTSVVLAAVNGHTQGHVGERLLAFNLLESSDVVLRLRNALTQDIREQELIYDNFASIDLDGEPGTMPEKLSELAAAINGISGYQAEVTGEAVTVKAQAASTATADTAVASAPAGDPGEKFAELLPRLQMKLGVSLEASYPTVRITHIKTAEEKLIDLRSLIDDSLDRKTKIKEPLMERARAEVNNIKSKLVKIEKSDLSDDEKQAQRDALNAVLERRIRVLTLFNKVGVKTVLSELAPEEVDVLREYLDAEVYLHGEWARLNTAERELITANRGIYDALQGRSVCLVVQLAMDWNNIDLGFSTMRGRGEYVNPDLGKLLTAIAGRMVEGTGRRPVLKDTLTGVGGLLQEHFFESPTTALLYYTGTRMTPAVALKNVHSSAHKSFSPADRFDALPYDRIAEQVAYLRAYLPQVLANDQLPKVALAKPPSQDDSAFYSVLRAILPDEFTADGEIPLADTVLVCMPQQISRAELYEAIIDGDVANAYFQITDIRASRIFYQLESIQMTAGYKYDDSFRALTHMVDGGDVQAKMPSNLSKDVLRRKLPFFECGPEFGIMSRYDATRVSGAAIQMDDIQILDGAMNSSPRKLGLLGISSAVSSSQIIPITVGPVAVVLEPDMRVKLLATGQRLAINPTEDDPEGRGYESPASLGDDFFAVAAHDMEALNGYRLKRMVGVTNELAEDFHQRGADAQEKVVTARAANDHIAYLQSLYESLGAEVKAYSQISNMSQDMLRAIIFYMILLLPFCFFVQKLLFKFVRVEAQMAMFGGIFVVIFAVFRFIHPAFRLARAPEAILIAFIMFSLGMFVIIILHARFEGEMKLLFQTFTGMDTSDVGTGSVVQKAMLIGVNNMKRRRTRTALTTGTIILITFAMLAFSSVSKKMSPTFVPTSKDVHYTGVLFHQAGSGKINDDTIRVFEELFATSAERVVVRTWDTPPIVNKTTYPYYVNVENGAGINLGGVLGLSQHEPGLLSPNGLPIIEGGRFFSADDADEAMLPVSAAAAMGLSAADVGTAILNYRGRPLALVGLFDDTRLSGLEDIDRHSILPMQSMQPTGAGGAEAAGDVGEEAEGAIFYVETSELLVLPLDTSRALGAEPYSIAVSLKDGESAWDAIDTLLTITGAKFWVASTRDFKVGAEQKGTLGAGVYYVGSGYKTSIGGMARLIVPILIAGTIILNTMLGSVYERKYEIAVYNAIGLNPTHIGLFFLAEAFVYAVIGSVGGYLIGQVLALAITKWNLVQGLNLNFSSLTVVYVILFTIVVVLLSTLYPAVVATRAAVPSGKRTWSLPANDGNQMQILMPFIYQPMLVAGIVEYLDDYFQRFSEASTGEMIATRQVKERITDASGTEVYNLDFILALAPYDLGVTQRVSFNAHFNTEINSYQIEMTVKRLSGQDANWVTTNRPFLEKLRKHMMHWRNMSRDNQKIYVKRAEAEFSGGHPTHEEPAPATFDTDSVPVNDRDGEPPTTDAPPPADMALFEEGADPKTMTKLDDKKSDTDSPDDTKTT